jgi:hypothetical protein
MGLFSGISNALFGDPGKGIQAASDAQMGFQQQGLDYMQGVNELPLEIRNQFLPMLQDYYGGGEGQNQFIEDTKSNPLYNQMIQAGQEGVLANSGAKGLSRSGNTAQDLSLSNQGVLRNLLNQRIQGMSSMANMPINTSGIANQYNSMGQNVANAGMATVNADQAQMGQLIKLGSSAFAASDETLKTNIVKTGSQNGFNKYSWTWNSLAKELFNLTGKGFGVIAQEVEKIKPQAVSIVNGKKVVNYNMIGVSHG